MCQKSREKTTAVVRVVILLLTIVDIFLQNYFRLSLHGIENQGISFGLGQGWGRAASVFAYVGVILWFVYDRWGSRRDNLAIFLMACGGLGNLVGRILWGSVWDYLCFSWLPFCFNLSDVLISLGVVSYILGVDGNRCFVRGQRHSGDQ